jgi:hypothetical protein
VVIDAKFGRENHGSIPHNCDWKGAGTRFIPELTLKPDSTGGENQKISLYFSQLN